MSSGPRWMRVVGLDGSKATVEVEPPGSLCWTSIALCRPWTMPCLQGRQAPESPDAWPGFTAAWLINCWSESLHLYLSLSYGDH